MNKDFFQFAASTSIVVFGFDKKQIIVLIQQRDREPFKGAPTLPTELLQINETADSKTHYLLNNLFGESQKSYTEQLKAFTSPYRHPSGRIINVAHYAVLDFEAISVSLPPAYKWFPVNEVPHLAFDHNEILDFAKERLKRRVKRRPIGFHLLPNEFTFKEIHTLYEQALNKTLDIRNFRKKLFNSKLLIDTEKSIRVEANYKPSSLFTFNTKEYELLTLKGYDFSFF